MKMQRSNTKFCKELWIQLRRTRVEAASLIKWGGGERPCTSTGKVALSEAERGGNESVPENERENPQEEEQKQPWGQGQVQPLNKQDESLHLKNGMAQEDLS